MKIEKVEKLVANLHEIMKALNHALVLKKVHKLIKFNQNAWIKPYIDMNFDLRKIAKNDFEEDFFKLMNNSVFRKTLENLRKHRDIKLVNRKKKELFSMRTKFSYYSTSISNRNEKNRDTY